jgi:hypothetical protein
MKGGAVIAIGVLGWAAWYALVCWLLPTTGCGRCAGIGKAPPTFRTGLRTCRRCKGTGQQIRTGRRLWTAVRP